MRRVLAAAALACALAACARHHEEPSYDAAVRAKGAQLAAQDRAAAERHRAEIARVVSGSARDVTPAGSTTERFIVHVTNHAPLALRRIDGGVIVYGGRGLHRLGLASFSAAVDVATGKSANVPVAIPLSAFAAEGAGALALARGAPKRVELELTGYRLASGGEQRETD